jgi:hypothetical protein
LLVVVVVELLHKLEVRTAEVVEAVAEALAAALEVFQVMAQRVELVWQAQQTQVVAAAVPDCSSVVTQTIPQVVQVVLVFC